MGVDSELEHNRNVETRTQLENVTYEAMYHDDKTLPTLTNESVWSNISRIWREPESNHKCVSEDQHCGR